MIKPFKADYRLTQGFGGNSDSYKKFGLLGHNGLDYGTPTGTEILAPHSGKVIEASSDPTGYGNYIKVENDKEGSVLAHLKEFKVKVGDQVNEGQLIGISDNTGNSTGPHLHWGYYTLPRNRQNGYAGFVNQLPLIGGVNVDQQKIIDELRTARDKNWDLYISEQARTKELQEKLTACESKPVNTEDTIKLNKLREALKAIL